MTNQHVIGVEGIAAGVGRLSLMPRDSDLLTTYEQYKTLLKEVCSIWF